MAENDTSTGRSEEERQRRLWLEYALQTPPPRPPAAPQPPANSTAAGSGPKGNGRLPNTRQRNFRGTS